MLYKSQKINTDTMNLKFFNCFYMGYVKVHLDMNITSEKRTLNFI